MLDITVCWADEGRKGEWKGVEGVKQSCFFSYRAWRKAFLSFFSSSCWVKRTYQSILNKPFLHPFMQNVSCSKIEPIIVHAFTQFQEPAWRVSIFHEPQLSPRLAALCSACSEGLLCCKSNNDSSKTHKQMKLPGFTSPGSLALSLLMLGGIWMLFQSLPDWPAIGLMKKASCSSHPAHPALQPHRYCSQEALSDLQPQVEFQALTSAINVPKHGQVDFSFGATEDRSAGTQHSILVPWFAALEMLLWGFLTHGFLWNFLLIPSSLFPGQFTLSLFLSSHWMEQHFFLFIFSPPSHCAAGSSWVGKTDHLYHPVLPNAFMQKRSSPSLENMLPLSAQTIFIQTFYSQKKKKKKKINSGQIGNVWEATVPFCPFSIEKDWTNCSMLNLWGESDKFWRKYWPIWRKRVYFLSSPRENWTIF